MRKLALAAPVWITLAGAAAAQTYPYPSAPPPRAPAYPPPSPTQAVPPGTSPYTGARPGNEVGTGMSMPMSNRASNINQYDTRSDIAPNLPAPRIGPDATPADYLRAAQASLVAGRTGEAQQSLEMAQTRMLDRSVPYGQTGTPSDNPAVQQISQALQALAAHDRARCLELIQAAIPTAQASYR